MNTWHIFYIKLCYQKCFNCLIFSKVYILCGSTNSIFAHLHFLKCHHVLNHIRSYCIEFPLVTGKRTKFLEKLNYLFQKKMSHFLWPTVTFTNGVNLKLESVAAFEKRRWWMILLWSYALYVIYRPETNLTQGHAIKLMNPSINFTCYRSSPV